MGAPRGRADGGSREGEGHLSRTDGEGEQARPRHRQDHRGQAWELLLAVRAPRPAVRARRQDDGQPARGAGEREDWRERASEPLRAVPRRRRQRILNELLIWNGRGWRNIPPGPVAREV